MASLFSNSILNLSTPARNFSKFFRALSAFLERSFAVLPLTAANFASIATISFPTAINSADPIWSSSCAFFLSASSAFKEAMVSICLTVASVTSSAVCSVSSPVFC